MFNKKKNKNKQALGRVGRVEQEHRYNQMIRITTISVVSIVLVVAIVGIILNLPPRVIVSVDGQDILRTDFEKRVRMERDRLVQEYSFYVQMAMSATDPNQQNQYGYYMSQVESQLDTTSLGESILNQMIDEILIIREAKARGITVTDQEVDDYFHGIFGYYPNGVPTPTLAPTGLPTSTLSPTQVALVTPTPAADEAAGDGTVINPEVPLPTSVSEDEFNTSVGQYLDNINQYNIDEAFIRELVRTQLYRDKLNSELAKGITPPTEEQVWARHILVGVEDLATAEDILQQLKDGGDFGDLARELSIDTGSGANGGDLGWFGRGMMIPEFEDAAFGGKIGEIVGPVETQYGFHIIQVLGHEDRPADANALDNLVFTALTELVNQQKEGSEIIFAENWIQYTPTTPDIPRQNPAQPPAQPPAN